MFAGGVGAWLGTRNMKPTGSMESMESALLKSNRQSKQQLTDHRIDGENVPNSKVRTVGLGPGVQFGGDSLLFRVNSYIETDVRNRPAGIKVTFRISKALPIRGPKS
jgi:hypothetical protein